MVKVERRVGEAIRCLTELGGEATITELRRHAKKHYRLGPARLYGLVKQGIEEGLLIRRLVDTPKGPRVVISLSERHPGIEKTIKFWRERFTKTESFAVEGQIETQEKQEYYKRLFRNELYFLLGTMCFELFNAVINAWLKAGEDRAERLRLARKHFEELVSGVIAPIAGSAINIAVAKPEIPLKILQEIGDEFLAKTRSGMEEAKGG